MTNPHAHLRFKPKGNKRPRAWHHGRKTGRAYNAAIRRLDRALAKAERKRGNKNGPAKNETGESKK